MSFNNDNNYLETIVISLNKVINSSEVVEKLYNLCIESKDTKIIKYKKITPITRKLQEIYGDLWRSHNLPLLSRNIYTAVLLNKFTRKSKILLFWSKNEFFDSFKLWLP